MKPLVALTKVYRGGEWFRASLESMRPHIQGVVAIQATRPYRPGPARPENTSSVLCEFAAARTEVKVITEVLDVADQAEHYLRGLELIRQNFGNDAGVLVIDSDEVWTDEGIAVVAEEIRRGRESYYVSRLYDYIRHPLWQATNEAGPFVIGLSSPNPPARVRTRFGGWQLQSYHKFPDHIRMHHFTLVREDESEIAEKMANCAHADGAYHPDWMSRVWAQLPAGTNLHPSPGWEKTWPCIQIVSEDQLPKAVLRCPRARAMLNAHQEKAS